MEVCEMAERMLLIEERRSDAVAAILSACEGCVVVN